MEKGGLEIRLLTLPHGRSTPQNPQTIVRYKIMVNLLCFDILGPVWCASSVSQIGFLAIYRNLTQTHLAAPSKASRLVMEPLDPWERTAKLAN